MDPGIWLCIVVILMLTTILMSILTVGVGMLIGAVLSDQKAADERARLAEREGQLQAEWDALQSVQRINEIGSQARTAMRKEALQHQSTTVFQYGTPR